MSFRPAIGSIRTACSRGTAFLAGREFVITSLHVVADLKESIIRGKPVWKQGPFQVCFGIHQGGHPSTVEPVEDRWGLVEDWVLLRMKKPPENIRPIELTPAVGFKNDWLTHGYPRDHKAGLTVSGHVADPRIVTVVSSRRVEVVQLYCVEAAAGGGLAGEGMSGAPCMAGIDDNAQAAFAMIRSSLSVEGANRGGVLFATPARDILNKCRDLLEPQASRQSDMTLRNHINGLGKSYSSNQMVLVAGPGISRSPTTSELVENLIQQAPSWHVGNKSLELIVENFQEKQYAQALSRLQTEVGPSFHTMVRQSLDDLTKHDSSVVDQFAMLRPRLQAVITTNFDDALQHTLGWRTSYTHASVPSDLPKRREYILYLYGKLDQPQSWVLTSTEHDRLLQNRELWDHLSVLFRSSTLLFVGWDLNSGPTSAHGSALEKLFDRLRNATGYRTNSPHHYALFARGSISRKRAASLLSEGLLCMPYDDSPVELLQRVVQLPQAQSNGNGSLGTDAPTSSAVPIGHGGIAMPYSAASTATIEPTSAPGRILRAGQLPRSAYDTSGSNPLVDDTDLNLLVSPPPNKKRWVKFGIGIGAAVAVAAAAVGITIMRDSSDKVSDESNEIQSSAVENDPSTASEPVLHIDLLASPVRSSDAKESTALLKTLLDVVGQREIEKAATSKARLRLINVKAVAAGIPVEDELGAEKSTLSDYLDVLEPGEVPPSLTLMIMLLARVQIPAEQPTITIVVLPTRGLSAEEHTAIETLVLSRKGDKHEMYILSAYSSDKLREMAPQGYISYQDNGKKLAVDQLLDKKSLEKFEARLKESCDPPIGEPGACTAWALLQNQPAEQELVKGCQGDVLRACNALWLKDKEQYAEIVETGYHRACRMTSGTDGCAKLVEVHQRTPRLRDWLTMLWALDRLCALSKEECPPIRDKILKDAVTTSITFKDQPSREDRSLRTLLDRGQYAYAEFRKKLLIKPLYARLEECWQQHRTSVISYEENTSVSMEVEYDGERFTIEGSSQTPLDQCVAQTLENSDAVAWRYSASYTWRTMLTVDFQLVSRRIHTAKPRYIGQGRGPRPARKHVEHLSKVATIDWQARMARCWSKVPASQALKAVSVDITYQRQGQDEYACWRLHLSSPPLKSQNHDAVDACIQEVMEYETLDHCERLYDEDHDYGSFTLELAPSP